MRATVKMKKLDAIEKLNTLVSRIPAIEKQKRFSEDFEKWQHDARVFLKHAFPNEEYRKEFDELWYDLAFCTTETPDSAFEQAFRSGLASARAMLLSRIDEIQEFWPEHD